MQNLITLFKADWFLYTYLMESSLLAYFSLPGFKPYLNIIHAFVYIIELVLHSTANVQNDVQSIRTPKNPEKN